MDHEIGGKRGLFLTSYLCICKAPSQCKVPTNPFEDISEALFFLIRAHTPSPVPLAGYPSLPYAFRLWRLHQSLILHSPQLLEHQLCLDFFWCEDQQALSPSLQGSLSVYSLLKMSQCINFHRVAGEREGTSFHQNFPLSSSAIQKEGPKSYIWSVHFFVYPALPKIMGEVASPDPSSLIETKITLY